MLAAQEWNRPIGLEGLALPIVTPIPNDEEARLIALRNYDKLDADLKSAYDDIVQLAAFVCSTPIAAVTLIDAERQWYKSAFGMSITEIPREAAFCAYTILQTDLMVVPDATLDQRFADNPFVTGLPHARFYAGAPLVTEEGHALGTLCVIDDMPRHLTPGQEAALRTLARQVSNQLELARRAAAQDQLVAERRRAEESVRESETSFRAITESTPVCIVITDSLIGSILYANPCAREFFGVPAGAPLGAYSASDFYQIASDRVEIVRELTLRPVVNREIAITRLDGTLRWGEGHFQNLRYHGEKCVIATYQDVTPRKALDAQRERVLQEALERADSDPLTGLLNHRAFHKRLDAEAARARREKNAFAVVMLDLDNFKFFNDVYGHASGDEVLLLVAGRLKAACRSYDTLARFGGDEFALLLPSVGQTTAADVEARIRVALDGLAYHADPLAPAIPVSVTPGAALFPDASMDWREVLRSADERLRWAKTGGGAEQNSRRVRMDAGSRVQGFSMLDALVTAVDNKDRYTRRHSEDVMEYSLMIARELGMDDIEQQTVAVAALIHDVGKIGVPDYILRKPGLLTEEEFEAVKQHPSMGAVMVQAAPGLEATLDAVRHHHERWDGGGYPSGLAGEATPLIARLMAVADAFSAMTTDRPYRKGMDRAMALSILQDGGGAQWDLKCVLAFIRSLENRDGH